MPLRLYVNMVFSVPISFLAPRISGMSRKMPEAPSTAEAMLVVVNELLFWAASFPVLLFYLWGCMRIWKHKKHERYPNLRKSCQGLGLVLQTVCFWLFQLWPFDFFSFTPAEIAVQSEEPESTASDAGTISPSFPLQEMEASTLEDPMVEVCFWWCFFLMKKKGLMFWKIQWFKFHHFNPGMFFNCCIEIIPWKPSSSVGEGSHFHLKVFENLESRRQFSWHKGDLFVCHEYMRFDCYNLIYIYLLIIVVLMMSALATLIPFSLSAILFTCLGDASLRQHSKYCTAGDNQWEFQQGLPVAPKIGWKVVGWCENDDSHVCFWDISALSGRKTACCVWISGR